MTDKHRPPLEAAKAHPLAALVDYATGATVSRILAKTSAGNLTIFSFDAGEGLSEHTSPYDAWVLILEGRAVLTIGGQDVAAKVGDVVLMPANVPHGLRAEERFKMLLILLREEPLVNPLSKRTGG